MATPTPMPMPMPLVAELSFMVPGYGTTGVVRAAAPPEWAQEQPDPYYLLGDLELVQAPPRHSVSHLARGENMESGPMLVGLQWRQGLC
nr:unnamed protein product [Digitaria exilis]